MKSVQRVALVSLLTGALTLGACTGAPRVRYDSDAHAVMANYHSYAWQQLPSESTDTGSAFNNPLNLKRLRGAVDANLAKQGLQPVAEDAAPDTYVVVSIGNRQVIETESWPSMRVGVGAGWGHGYYPGYYPGYMGSMYWDSDRIYSYHEGRIAIDLYDARTREAIWHASVEQDLTNLTGDKAESRINAAVAAMFAKFPKTASRTK